MHPSCYFQIPRGNTAVYVFVFYLYGSTYNVLLKQKLGNNSYKIVNTYKVPINNVQNFINTIVANVY